MSRRIIICSLSKYPRGCANANYLQYLTDALVASGYDVYILTTVNSEHFKERRFEYRNVKVIDIWYHSKIKLLARVMNGKLFDLRFAYHLLKLKPSKDDLIIPSDNAHIFNPCMLLKKLIHFKTCGLPLEWFPKEIFNDTKTADIKEKDFQNNAKHDLIFPISHLIAEQFENGTSKVQVLPIMADASEYPFEEKNKGNYEFVLPANGLMKDALNNMMLGIAELSNEELSRVTFHLRGIKPEQVQHIVGETDWEKIQGSLRFYGWMKYDELIGLFRKSHYMLLAREDNQMTRANFPSKVPEVMTHGVVPVVTRVGDYTKYYLENEKNSIIFEGCSSSACAEAIRKAINLPFDEYLVLSQNARKCVEEKFDYHNWINIIRDNIEALF